MQKRHNSIGLAVELFDFLHQSSIERVVLEKNILKVSIFYFMFENKGFWRSLVLV